MSINYYFMFTLIGGARLELDYHGGSLRCKRTGVRSRVGISSGNLALEVPYIGSHCMYSLGHDISPGL